MCRGKSERKQSRKEEKSWKRDTRRRMRRKAIGRRERMKRRGRSVELGEKGSKERRKDGRGTLLKILRKKE